MSISATAARMGVTNHQCRARRLARERAVLAEKLLAMLTEMPDAICFDFNDLRHLAGYRILEQEGLVHVRIRRPGGCITVIAAAGRVLKRPDLRGRLFALRRLAQQEFRRVVIATPKGLVNEAARLRARRAAGLTVVLER